MVTAELNEKLFSSEPRLEAVSVDATWEEID